jgi:threonine/homoserine/homoserine lactone efflux protein
MAPVIFQALTQFARIDLKSSSASALSLRAIFWRGFFSDVLNPKVALFFLAFLPQFVTSGTGDQTKQLLVLGVTGNVIAISINLVLVYVKAAYRSRSRSSTSSARNLLQEKHVDDDRFGSIAAVFGTNFPLRLGPETAAIGQKQPTRYS